MRTLATLTSLVCLAPLSFAQTQTKLAALQGAAEDHFGRSVAVGAQYWLCGAPGASFPGLVDGSVVVFNAQSGLEERVLTTTTSWTAFGNAVAVEGNLGLIGAPLSDQGAPNSGVALVYDLPTGTQIFRFTPSDAAANDALGQSVALDGGRALVGASGSGPLTGKAYLFDPLTGVELAQFSPVDLALGDLFGVSVDLDGDLALIGASRHGGSGAAYLIDVTTGQTVHKWTPTSGFANAGFGEKVALDGDVAVVGARWENASGRAHVYSVSTGQELGVLQPPIELGSSPWFGASVDVDGTRVCVGASLASTAYGATSGAVLTYDVANLASPATLIPAANSFADQFGWGLSLHGDTLLVGAPGDDPFGTESGSATRFDFSSNTNSGVGACFPNGLACGCDSVQGPAQGCGNSTRETGAALTATGDAVISADTFRLQVSGVPGQRPALVLRGAQLLNSGAGNPAGDGFLCAAGLVARSQVQLTSVGIATFTDFQGQPFGSASYGPGVPVHYQVWYRDPENTCSGQGFNFSNAWTVTWQL